MVREGVGGMREGLINIYLLTREALLLPEETMESLAAES